MKRTKQTWLFFILEIVFMLVAPCIFIWVQNGGLATGYKISVTSIILLLIVFVIFKKIFIDKWLVSIEQKKTNIETNALSITDKKAILTNKKSWRLYSVVSLFTSCFIPLLAMLLGVITIKVVEQGLIKLFGCLVFCLISIAIGVLFKFAEIYSMKLAHEE